MPRPLTENQIIVQERQERARLLHLEGQSYQKIADTLGYATSTAAYRASNKATLREPVLHKNDRIQEEDDRITWLIAKAVEILYDHHYIIEGRDAIVVKHPETGRYLDDIKPKLEALKLIQALSRDRRRLLGLDVPLRKQIEVLTEDRISVEIAKLEAEMADNDQLLKMIHGDGN